MLVLVVLISFCAPVQSQEPPLSQAVEADGPSSDAERRIGLGVHAGAVVGTFRSRPAPFPSVGTSVSFNPISAMRIRGHLEAVPLPAIGIVQAGLGVAWSPGITPWLQPVIGIDMRGALTTKQNDVLELFIDESSVGGAVHVGADLRVLSWLAIQPFVDVAWYPGLETPILPSFNLGVAVFPDVF